ncbi:MAG: HEAT repeat domain-containing protein [Planctomycetota bacterium]|jgi:hypothetical protein
MKHALLLSLALFLLLPAGCESGGEEKDDADTPSTTRSKPKPPARAGKGEGFTAEERATMEAAWSAFTSDSPEWPLYRDDWVSLGPKATNTLVDNLLRAMILARIRNYPEGYDRARKELILLGPATLETLAGVLERGTYRDPAKNEDRSIPSGVVTDVTEILVAAGKPAVAHLAGLLDHESPTVRRACAEALGRLRDPGGYAPLEKMLTGSSDWADRMIAARAVGYYRTKAASRALVAALEDPDESVVAESARSLARMKTAGAVPALESRAKKARAAGEYRIERACKAAVRTIRSGR